MSDPAFFRATSRPSLAEICAWTGAVAAPDADLAATIDGLAALDDARPGMLAFLDNPRYLGALARTRASACLVAPAHAQVVSAAAVALMVNEPLRAFARVAASIFPASLRPLSYFEASGIAPGATVHPQARLEPGVVVDPGAVIGPRAEIGTGTVIGATSTVGPDVRIGRNCSIGPGVTLAHALIGDRVVIHAGARIGQDGFGFVMSQGRHEKVPQIGRVIVQDDVEIGANTTIDRGANRDTVIGEGTKIDNLVQIAHNVAIGRHCIIVAQVGISGSTTLGDFVVVGGQAGFAGHIEVGRGARIAAKAGVTAAVPQGAVMGGMPARPLRQWLRGRAMVERLARARHEASE